jgi:hypothetical protein
MCITGRQQARSLGASDQQDAFFDHVGIVHPARLEQAGAVTLEGVYRFGHASTVASCRQAHRL